MTASCSITYNHQVTHNNISQHPTTSSILVLGSVDSILSTEIVAISIAPYALSIRVCRLDNHQWNCGDIYHPESYVDLLLLVYRCSRDVEAKCSTDRGIQRMTVRALKRHVIILLSLLIKIIVMIVLMRGFVMDGKAHIIVIYHCIKVVQDIYESCIDSVRVVILIMLELLFEIGIGWFINLNAVILYFCVFYWSVRISRKLCVNPTQICCIANTEHRSDLYNVFFPYKLCDIDFCIVVSYLLRIFAYQIILDVFNLDHCCVGFFLFGIRFSWRCIIHQIQDIWTFAYQIILDGVGFFLFGTRFSLKVIIHQIQAIYESDLLIVLKLLFETGVGWYFKLKDVIRDFCVFYWSARIPRKLYVNPAQICCTALSTEHRLYLYNVYSPCKLCGRYLYCDFLLITDIRISNYIG